MTRSAIIALMFTWPLAAQSQSNTTVYVSINSQHHTQIEPGFAGYNVALMYVAFDYRYLRFGAEVRRLSPGWLRYPAGTRSEAFDWTTGASHQSWVDGASLSFSDDVRTDFREVLQSSMEVLAAKGGEHLDDAAALARTSGARGLIICLNVFTDTPASAKQFVAYARRHGIRVLAWELGNEPYLTLNSGPQRRRMRMRSNPLLTRSARLTRTRRSASQ